MSGCKGICGVAPWDGQMEGLLPSRRWRAGLQPLRRWLRWAGRMPCFCMRLLHVLLLLSLLMLALLSLLACWLPQLAAADCCLLLAAAATLSWSSVAAESADAFGESDQSVKLYCSSARLYLKAMRISRSIGLVYFLVPKLVEGIHQSIAIKGLELWASLAWTCGTLLRDSAL